MKAVVTAGGRIDGEYARAAGTQLKALAPVRGETMLDRTIRALRDLGVTCVAVVGNDEVRERVSGRVEIVPDAGSGARNVLAALDVWPIDGEPLLYLTCDMPYVDAGAIAGFLGAVSPSTLAMPLAEHAAFSARFPNAPAFGISLAGERVVNGGVFHIPPPARVAIRSFATALFDARKAPWRMAAIAGPSLVFRLILKRLSIGALEARARKVLRTEVAAIRNCAPELAFDADTVEEYRYACERE